MLKTRRNSSFELLRIILIVMILVEHGNMWFVGGGYSLIVCLSVGVFAIAVLIDKAQAALYRKITK